MNIRKSKFERVESTSDSRLRTPGAMKGCYYERHDKVYFPVLPTLVAAPPPRPLFPAAAAARLLVWTP